MLGNALPISDKATSIMVNEIIDKKIKKMEYSSAMRETKRNLSKENTVKNTKIPYIGPLTSLLAIKNS